MATIGQTEEVGMRVARTSARISCEERRFQGVLSENYDLIELWLPDYNEIQDVVATAITSRYRAPLIVDIGLGTGGTSKAILTKSPEARIIGIDNEISMLAGARVRLSSQIWAGSVRICEADALEALESFPDESLEVVASALTLHNWADNYRAQVEREILRILRPGGMLINNDKYAADEPKEYICEIASAILCFDTLISMNLHELRRALIEHEIEDQHPERIMWTGSALQRLGAIGFERVSLLWRRGQQAAVVAFKPAE